MLDATSDQKQKLHDIAEAIKATNYGQEWPPDYSEMFLLWGFFNSIYSTLYSDQKEWKRIGRFALNDCFKQIWNVLGQDPAVEELAHQPCIGDGRSSYAPSEHTRIAFRTLRLSFNLDVKDVCQSSKCQLRKQNNIPICLDQDLTPPNSRNPENHNPENAKFDPFGATLLVIYQIRNNLFHGSKNEIQGHEYERNKQLVKLSNQIIRLLLKETKELLCQQSEKT